MTTTLTGDKALIREIRSLKTQISEIQNTLTLLTAARYRRVTISDYARENNVTSQCVRKRILRGVLNAERIGNMYYIIQPL